MPKRGIDLAWMAYLSLALWAQSVLHLAGAAGTSPIPDHAFTPYTASRDAHDLYFDLSEWMTKTLAGTKLNGIAFWHLCTCRAQWATCKLRDPGADICTTITG